jgi:hypothetical protein
MLRLIKSRHKVEDKRLKELIDTHISFIKAEAELDVLMHIEEKVDQEQLVLKNNLSKKIEEVRGFLKKEYPDMFDDLDFTEFMIRNMIISMQNIELNDKYTDESYKEYEKMMDEREKELLAVPVN